MKLPGKKGKQHILIAGDFNLHIDWQANQPQINSATKTLDEQLLRICDTFNLEQKVNFSTRGNNTLDLFLTSEPSKVTKIRPSDPLSDHDLIVADLDLCLKKKPNSQHLIYNWKKADTNNISREVMDKMTDFTLDEANIDKNWENFRNILLEARDKYVPSRKSTSRHNLPWYHQELRRLGNKKQ